MQRGPLSGSGGQVAKYTQALQSCQEVRGLQQDVEISKCEGTH